MAAVSADNKAGLKTEIAARARAAGFDAVGFTVPERVADQDGRLRAFLGGGMHGDMGWMAETVERRRHPLALWPEARGIVVLGMNYGPEDDPLAALAQRGVGAVSVYAQGRDYHDIVKGKLKLVAGWMHARTGHAVKVYVDTAPVMEKPVAAAAGLGWQGKHTNLVSRRAGSWLFLGTIFTTLSFPPDAPETDHCGACRRCLDICPTRAFPAPYRLDARRCISYLTVEHKGHIAPEFRAAMGNRIYGCDDCLAVCPWNKFAHAAAESKFKAGPMAGAPLAELLRLDDAAFRKAYAGSPVKRTGLARFMRNVLIAAGNSGDAALIVAVTGWLAAESPLIRAAAVWALARLLDVEPFAALKAQHHKGEPDAQVRAEWERTP